HYGRETMHLRPMTNPGSSGVFKTGRLGRATEELPCTTLDNLIQKTGIAKVRFMKVDCEGSEHRVIRGAIGALKAKQFEFIGLEYHPTIGPDAIEQCESTHRLLLSVGYILSKVDGLSIYHLPGGGATLNKFGSVIEHDRWQE